MDSIGRQDEGYCVGNLDKLDARYKCVYCKLLLRDPMQGDCGHRYCKCCVKVKCNVAIRIGDKSMCDACDEDEAVEISLDRAYPDNAIRREISKKLQLLCPNSPCDEAMLLKDLLEHLPNCQYRPVHCPACNDQIPFCTLDQHTELECTKRPVPCTKCGEQVGFDELDKHQATECIGNTRQCQYCLERVMDSDEDMDEHLKNACSVGWHKDKPCPFGCLEIIDGDWQKHRQECHVLHLDRVLAKAKQLQLQLGDCASAGDANAGAVATASAIDNKQEICFDSRVVGKPEQQTADNALANNSSELREELRHWTERLKEVESLAKKANLSDIYDDGKGLQFAGRLNQALSQSEQVYSVLHTIKSKLEAYSDKVKGYETKFRMDLAKKLDIETKYQDLLKLLAYKEVKILELERRIEILESSSYDGVLVWKITDVARRKSEAREAKVCSIYSPPFFTGKAGYKMCGRLYLNGDGAGKTTHVSLFFVIMRGQYDALMPWPFSKKVTMMLLDQNFEENVIDAFKPDTTSSSFKRPVSNMNIASGCPLFMPLQDFESADKGYVKDDTMFIKFIVDKTDLPS